MLSIVSSLSEASPCNAVMNLRSELKDGQDNVDPTTSDLTSTPSGTNKKRVVFSTDTQGRSFLFIIFIYYHSVPNKKKKRN